MSTSQAINKNAIKAQYKKMISVALDSRIIRAPNDTNSTDIFNAEFRSLKMSWLDPAKEPSASLAND